MALTNHIVLPTVPGDYCLERILRENMENVEFYTIFWSHRIDDFIKEKILKLFIDKGRFILTKNERETPNHSHIKTSSTTTFILASTKEDIITGLSSLHDKNMWNFMSKFIVLYLDESGNERHSVDDQFFKDIFQMFADHNALNVHIIYKFDDGIDEFTWFPFQDSNCATINRMRLISECEFGSHRNHSRNRRENKSESRCTVRVAVQSHEPYSFYSKDTGFSKGIDVELMKELGHWLHLDVEFGAIDNSSTKQEADLGEEYIYFSRERGQCNSIFLLGVLK